MAIPLEQLRAQILSVAASVAEADGLCNAARTELVHAQAHTAQAVDTLLTDARNRLGEAQFLIAAAVGKLFQAAAVEP
jgi:hypothetical protein